MTLHLSKLGVFLGASGIFAGIALAGSQDRQIIFADQGPDWNMALRNAYYVQDQGSRLMPLAWFKALRQENGKPFAEGSLTRYGYLPSPPEAGPADLPLGFSLANSSQGPMVGMTCASCHTRDISVGGVSYRIDGGPAFADFQSFIVDLDAAVLRALASDAAFKSFAESVLGADAVKPEAAKALHDAVALWSLRFHTWVDQTPADKPWGPARLDAIAMIYNRLNGLDLGPAPGYMLAGNMQRADAPTRYPFLWNAGRQDRTQWGGWAGNGTDSLALARNLGQVFGVFAAFHPEPKSGNTLLDRDYLSANSANIAGLATAESILKSLGPPVWPFPVDHALAERGREIFNRPTAQGGCVECHGVTPGSELPWKTVVADVGTDSRQWQIVLRQARTGTLEGATVPGVAAPLHATDLSLNILKTVITGTLAEVQAAQAAAAQSAVPAAQQQVMTKPSLARDSATGAAAKTALAAMTHEEMKGMVHVPDMPAETEAKPAQMEAKPEEIAPGTPVYEARVLRGIWAAAPYLHNGSVPSLAELLKPAAQRVKEFKVGPAYDTKTVGLAAEQAGTFTLKTTGCEDRNSGNSNCGHDYGTQLPDAEKAALLEYLKTF